MKSLTKIAFTLLIISSINASAKYKVLARVTSEGGPFGYKQTSCVPKIFNLLDDNGNPIQRTGYDVSCSGRGFDNCPKLGAEFLPINPPSDWDIVQVNQIDILLKYAFEKIGNGIGTGTYSVKVWVSNERSFRIYEVSWSEESNISIYRTDTPF